MKEKLQAILEKLQSIVDRLPALIETGKKQQKIDAWDAYQKGGGRKDYNAAFTGMAWNQDTFTPRHDLQPLSADYMFSAHNSAWTGEDAPEPYDLVEHLEKLGVTLDFSKAKSMAHCFRHARITHVGTIDLSGCDVGIPEPVGEVETLEDGTQIQRHAWWGRDIYRGCFEGSCIEVIDKLVLPACPQPPFSRLFFPPTLVDIGAFEGYHIHRPMYLAHAPNVSHDTLMRIINALHDVRKDSFYNGGDPELNYFRLTLGDTNLAKLTEEEIAVATGKGWIVLGGSAAEDDGKEDTVDAPVIKVEAATAATETEEGVSV